MAYIYTEANRLESPHKYMYTKFEGYGLINSYQVDRMDALNRVSITNNHESIAHVVFDSALKSHLTKWLDQQPTNICARFYRLLSQSNQQNILNNNFADERIVSDLASRLPTYTDAEPIITLELLESIIASQLMGLYDESVKEWLDRVLQRFEVSKKLYEVYPEGFRKGEGNSSSVLLYWLLALCLGLYHVKTQSIKYLSTLLKTCDLLCSLPDSIMFGQLTKETMTIILSIEILSVEMLAEDKVSENAI